MNIVKSPYELLLDRLGLSPVQQSLTPAQMQGQLMAKGQMPQHFAEGSLVSSLPGIKELPGLALQHLGPIGAALTASHIPSQLKSGDREGAFNTALEAGSWLAPKALGLLGLAIQSNQLNSGEHEQLNDRRVAESLMSHLRSPVISNDQKNQYYNQLFELQRKANPDMTQEDFQKLVQQQMNQ